MVNIVESAMRMTSATNMMEALLGENHGVILRPAAFSYNEINDAMELLANIIFGDLDIPEVLHIRDIFRSAQTRHDINGIIVFLYDISEESIAMFKRHVLDSPMVTLKNSVMT